MTGPRRTPALKAYAGAAQLLGPAASVWLDRRASAGKEDRTRLSERRGIASLSRPEGALVWLHAASVGESLVALSLAEALTAARSDLSILITSGTVTSAGLIARRAPQREHGRRLAGQRRHGELRDRQARAQHAQRRARAAAHALDSLLCEVLRWLSGQKTLSCAARQRLQCSPWPPAIPYLLPLPPLLPSSSSRSLSRPAHRPVVQ